jgi:hypothetical protein
MLELELIVVLIGLGAEPDLLHLDLHLLGLHFLLALLLLVEELGVVDETANGRIGIGRNLYEIDPLLSGHVQCIASWNNGASIVTHYADFTHTYLFVDTVLILQIVILHQLLFKKSAAKLLTFSELTKFSKTFFYKNTDYKDYKDFFLLPSI